MANMDHVFIKIDMARGKPDGIAVARTDRKGTPLCSYTGEVSASDTFADLIERMKKEILSGLSREYIVIAHYPEVERAILAKEQEGNTKNEVFEGRAWVSVSQLVWPMVDCQMLPSSSFDSVCAYFQVKREDVTCAQDDVTALARIYFEMMRRYRAALVVEEGVRDFAGDSFDKIRRMVGF